MRIKSNITIHLVKYLELLSYKVRTNLMCVVIKIYIYGGEGPLI